MVTKPSTETKPSVTKPEPTKSENKSESSPHTGAHPDSFELHNLERNFVPTDDDALDELRWIQNEFFNSHGPTTVVRLDELTNLANKTYEGRGDTSDRQLATAIIMRAGLSDHPRYRELVDKLAVGLGEINDPGKWLHGYGNTSEREGTSSATT